jgi:hypothetical protein
LARRVERSDCAAKEEVSEKKNEREKKKTNLEGHGDAGRACGCKVTAARLGRAAARITRKRRAWGTGAKARGERVAKAAPAAGRVWRYHRWETRCAQPRGGNAVTWLQKRKLEKNKTIEKTRKHTRIPAVPVPIPKVPR